MILSIQKRNILQLFALLAGILILSQVLNLFYFRIDLTAEKRYTLSSNTLELLREQNRNLYFQIFLDGELPPGFHKLRKATAELLEEFSQYAECEIQYEFTNPLLEANPSKRQQVFNDLVERGIQPTNLQEKDVEGGLSQKIIFPGVIVHNWEKETTVNLLKNISGVSAEVNLNNSIEALEYELTSAIRMLNGMESKSVAFLTGHGELNQYQVADISASLAQYYQVSRIVADELALDFKKFDVLIIAQPRNSFPEKDKYAIDQYVMNGGRVLWLIDEVSASMDSLSSKETTFAFYKPLNLEDQLFRYGVRINPDLIMDAQCLLVPVRTSLPGEPTRFTPGPWYYSPLLVPPETHPITRNLNLVKAEFSNSIDTVGQDTSISKTVLLQSSQYTRLEKIPAPISLAIMRKPLDSRAFQNGSKPVAVLLEGQFTSVFQHRILKQKDEKEFRKKSAPTRMIVIADGDMIRNRVRGAGNNRQIEALGYDRYSRQTYGNRKFILNCVNYLCDDKGWMHLRSREVKLRMLDKSRIREHRLKWQLINLLMPLGILFLYGAITIYIRKRKYIR